jgi:hypothetical protein
MLAYLAASSQDPGLLVDAIRALPLAIGEADVRALAELAQRTELA